MWSEDLDGSGRFREHTRSLQGVVGETAGGGLPGAIHLDTEGRPSWQRPWPPCGASHERPGGNEGLAAHGPRPTSLIPTRGQEELPARYHPEGDPRGSCLAGVKSTVGLPTGPPGNAFPPLPPTAVIGVRYGSEQTHPSCSERWPVCTTGPDLRGRGLLLRGPSPSRAPPATRRAQQGRLGLTQEERGQIRRRSGAGSMASGRSLGLSVPRVSRPWSKDFGGTEVPGQVCRAGEHHMQSAQRCLQPPPHVGILRHADLLACSARSCPAPERPPRPSEARPLPASSCTVSDAPDVRPQVPLAGAAGRASLGAVGTVRTGSGSGSVQCGGRRGRAGGADREPPPALGDVGTASTVGNFHQREPALSLSLSRACLGP